MTKHTRAINPELTPEIMIQKLEIDRVVIDGDTWPHGGGQGHFAHINAL